MDKLLYWGDELNWMPVVFLFASAVIVLLGRLLTVWIFLRKLSVPGNVSGIYFLSGIALIASTLWGLISTAWWMLPLGFLAWYLVHIPFRDAMEIWASVQKGLMMSEDAEALLKGGLTAEQEKKIKKRLGVS